MSMIDILDKGGVVVWILAAYSVVALSIALERYIHFIRMGKTSANTIQDIIHTETNEKIQQRMVQVSGPDGAILNGIINAFINSSGTNLTQVATRIGSEELQRMERGFRTLGFLGNSAPLLGLLGTIIGMIKAFMVIEAAGGKVDAQALAGGIWEAMITTGIGLAVSIPVLLLLHMLEGSADKRASSMHRNASMLIERLSQNNTLPDESSAIHHREGTVHAV